MNNKKVFISWISLKDIENNDSFPLKTFFNIYPPNNFDEIILIHSFDNISKDFITKININNPKISIKIKKLINNNEITNLEKIYISVKDYMLSYDPDKTIEWHIFVSNGTLQMATAFILLGKTIFDGAILYESIQDSKESDYKIIKKQYNFNIKADLIKTDTNTVNKNWFFSENNKIIYKSKLMEECIDKAYKVAKTDYPVLILGETGTGKELLAKFIHDNSERKDKEFIIVHCGAIPDTLLESELFGYEKGAFTGANKSKIGYFEKANGGTIFLDEFGEINHLTQMKILRFLQYNEIQKLGSEKTIKLNVRIIAATNKNLEEMINNKEFRSDVFYRISTALIYIPPLRERREDILEIANYILDNENYKLSKISIYKKKSFTKDAIDFLYNYDWKGNVRELENTIKRICIWSDNNKITKKDFIDYGFYNIEFNTEKNIKNYDTNLSLKENLEKIEKEFIKTALLLNDSNIKKTAKYLKIKNYQTLQHYRKKYRI